jgi:hypothetical protein
MRNEPCNDISPAPWRRGYLQEQWNYTLSDAIEDANGCPLFQNYSSEQGDTDVILAASELFVNREKREMILRAIKAQQMESDFIHKQHKDNKKAWESAEKWDALYELARTWFEKINEHDSGGRAILEASISACESEITQKEAETERV